MLPMTSTPGSVLVNESVHAGRLQVATPPGGVLIWLIVLLEVFTFGIGLVAFMLQGAAEPEVFRRGREALNQTIGLINTLVLLTGGWCMANGISRLRANDARQAERWTTAAALAALGFLVLKGFEYAEKIGHGHTLHADTFFTLYWLLTGFHFLHVATALVVLLVMVWGLRRGRYNAVRHEDVESSGIFWHLCDLIWLLLYPILYLLR